MRTFRLVLCLTFFAAAAVAQPQEFSPFLLPLAPTSMQPGSHGSMWRVDFAVANESGTSLNLLTDASPPLQCGPIATCAFQVPPGATYAGVSLAVANPVVPALLYSVRREVSPLAMSLRVTSTPEGEEETRIPVVAEDELLTDPTSLVDVRMTSPRRRTLLRLYDVDPSPGSALRVRAYSFSGLLLADHVVPLLVPQQPSGGPAVFPGYAAVVLDASFFSVAQLNPDLPLRVRIDPMVPGQRYWAMVSMTSNSTNHVTLVVPEP